MGLMHTLLLWSAVSYDVTDGAPRNRQQDVGPCVGMDCLHGVLMHGDNEQGDSHKAEDTYERLEREDRMRQPPTEKPGPCEGSDCLHELLHDSAVDGKQLEHHKEIGPELIKKPGPEEGMGYLHGVLMHGDEKPGQKHISEDAKMQKPTEQHEPDEPCLDCLEGHTHNAHLKLNLVDDETEHHDPVQFGTSDPDSMLHATDGENHVETAGDEAGMGGQQQPPPTIYDPDSMLHPDGSDHSPKLEQEEVDISQPLVFDPDRLLHEDGEVHDGHMEQRPVAKVPRKPGTYDMESALHGEDAEVIHGKTVKKAVHKQEKPGTYDMESALHGEDAKSMHDIKVKDTVQKQEKPGTYDMESALHGEDAKSIHDRKVKDTVQKQEKPGIYDMESALHGEDAQSIHNHKVKASVQQEEAPGIFNPDTLLHGGDKHAHDKSPEKVELGKITDQHEQDDFKRWMAEKIRKGEAQQKESGVLGFSRAFISDSVLDDIDQMKQRYVMQDWGHDDTRGEDGTSKKNTALQAFEEAEKVLEDDLQKELAQLRDL